MNIEEYEILQKAEAILRFEAMRGCYFEEQWTCIINAHSALATAEDVIKKEIDKSAVLPEVFLDDSEIYYFVMAHGDPDSETSGGFGDLVGIFDTHEKAIKSLQSVKPWFNKSVYKFENGKLEEVCE